MATLLQFPAARSANRQAVWSLLELAKPGLQPVPLGILFVDSDSGSLTLRLRSPEELDLDEVDAEIVEALAVDLETQASRTGGHPLLATLEDSLSGFLRISDRTEIEYSGSPSRAADRLFDRHVDQQVRPFVTHLPVYALRAAATKFGEEFDAAETAEPDEWLRAPRGLHLAEGMFVVQVVGRSMEPLIPDGSYCVFRGPVTGSRQGKRLLIEQTGAADPAARYTVKRYTSRKSQDPATGEWQHQKIRLEPLNPEFDAFDLGADEFRVIGEFVQVLPD